MGGGEGSLKFQFYFFFCLLWNLLTHPETLNHGSEKNCIDLVSVKKYAFRDLRSWMVGESYKFHLFRDTHLQTGDGVILSSNSLFASGSRGFSLFDWKQQATGNKTAAELGHQWKNICSKLCAREWGRGIHISNLPPVSAPCGTPPLNLEQLIPGNTIAANIGY